MKNNHTNGNAAFVKKTADDIPSQNQNLAQSFYEVILSSLPHGITILNTKGQIIFANNAAKKILNTSRFPQKSKALVNKYDIYDENGNKLSQKDLPSQQVLLTKKPQERLLRFWHKDIGIETWSQVKSQPLIENGIMIGVVNVFHDLTSLKKSQSRITFLNSLSEKLISSLNYDIRLKKLAEQIVPTIADWCAIDMVNSRGELERVVVAHQDEEKIALAKRLQERFPADPSSNTGSYGVLKSGKAEFHPRVTEKMIEDSPAPRPLKEILKKLHLSSIVILPLIARNKKLGVITFAHSDSNRQYVKEDIGFLKNIASKAALLCDNGKMYATVVQTLKAQQKFESQLRESTDTLSLALSASRMGIWDWDRETNKLVWNEQLEAVHRLGTNKFKGTFSHFFSLIHPDDRGKIQKEITKALRERKVFEMEYRLNPKRSTEKEVWVYSAGEVLLNEKGYPVRLIGIGMDITDRKHYEKNIIEREKKFRAIYNSVTEAMFITNTKDEILEINAASEEMFPIQKGKSLIKQLKPFLTQNYYASIKDSFNEMQKTGSSRCEIEIKFSDERNYFLDILFKKDFITSQNLIVMRDVTDLKHEARRREHFLSIASHELRSPLANIKVYLELLKKRTDVKDIKTTEYITKAEQKVDMVTKLISDLLDVTRIREGKLDLYFEFIEAKSYLKNLVKDLQFVVPSHKIVLTDIATGTVMIDKIRIAQVVTNLVVNAAKYSDPGSKIYISSKMEKEQLHISVIDEGIGISKKELPNLFAIYNQGSSPSKSGLGLGLYISKQIVVQHTGNMNVTSKIGRGSTFTFSLPVQS